MAGARDRVNAGEPVVTCSRQLCPPEPGCAWPETQTDGGVPVVPVWGGSGAGCRCAGGARRHRRWGTSCVPAGRGLPGDGQASVRRRGSVFCYRKLPRLPARSPGIARMLFRSCRSVQASRHGRRDASSARAASRFDAHGHRRPHQTQSPSGLGSPWRASRRCASCQRRRSTMSAGAVWSTMTIPYPSISHGVRS